MKAFIFIALFLAFSCNNNSKTTSSSEDNYTLDISMIRIDQAGLDPFVVVPILKKNGVPLSGATLNLNVPRGTLSAITDNGDGSYKDSFPAKLYLLEINRSLG